MFNKKSIRDYDFHGKRALVRVDFNVPIKDGKVGDDTRIQAALPTLNYLLDQGASLVLCSHLGRPKSGPAPEFSMRPVAEHLSQVEPARGLLRGVHWAEGGESRVGVKAR